MSKQIENISLVFWNLDKDGKTDAPSVARVREVLTANSLQADRAADVPESTAFTRAVAEVLKERKDLTAKVFTRKEDKARIAQFDTEIQDNGRIHRRFYASYKLNSSDAPTEGETVVVPGPAHVSGEIVTGIEQAYAHSCEYYAWMDISKVVRLILDKDGMGAYSPKKNGGVYYVPVRAEAADLLNRIERFADTIGCRFLRHDIPDTSAQRAEIADAISDSFGAEIDTHTQAIDGYSAESTKHGVMENRREAIRATESSMARLQAVMNGRFNELRERMREQLYRIARLETAMEERSQAEQQAESLEGGRNIVGVA